MNFLWVNVVLFDSKNLYLIVTFNGFEKIMIKISFDWKILIILSIEDKIFLIFFLTQAKLKK